MRIENMLKCTVYYPYAGVLAKNGRDLKAGEITGELEATRFLDARLQRDAQLGKVKIYLSEADKAMLGHEAVEDIKKENNRIWPAATIIPAATPTAPIANKKEVKIEQPKKEPAKPAYKPQPLPAVEEIKVDNMDINSLNKTPVGVPEFTQKGKSSPQEISKHMGSIV